MNQTPKITSKNTMMYDALQASARVHTHTHAHTHAHTPFPAPPQNPPQKQLPAKGGKGGYREQYPLADANRCAVGGWDIRATPLGDALYESHVLDYDLVRQVRFDASRDIVVLRGGCLGVLSGFGGEDWGGVSQFGDGVGMVLYFKGLQG